MTVIYLGQTTDVAVALPSDATSTSYYFKFTDEYTKEELTATIQDNSVAKERYSLFSIDADAIGFETTGYYTAEIYNWDGSVVGEKIKEIYVNVL